MTYEQWISLLNRGPFGLTSSQLKAVNQALKEYRKTWLPIDLLQLEERLDEWKDAKDRAEGNQHWRTARQGATKTPFEQLAAFVQAERQRLSLDKQKNISFKLRDAAEDILNAYSAHIPDFYRRALEQTFISPPSEHVYCYRYYDDAASWLQHLTTCHLPKGVAAAQINGYCPTIEAGTDLTNIRGGVVAPPANRRIEFTKQAHHHTIVHEMLHWICHEDFRVATKTRGTFSPDEMTVMLEGTTEYLARDALKEMDRGGYGDFMPAVITTVQAGKPAVSDICKAFFQGNDIKTVMTKLVKEVGPLASGKPTGPKFSTKLNFPRRQDADPKTATPDFHANVQMYCKGKTVAQVAADLNPAWAAWLKQQGVIT